MRMLDDRFVSTRGYRVALLMEARGSASGATLRDFVNEVCVSLRVPSERRPAFVSLFLAPLAAEFRKVQHHSA